VGKVEGKQYKFHLNDIIKLEKIEGLNAGDKIGKKQRLISAYFDKNF